MNQYEQYSQFESVKEFNHHIEMWLLETKQKFSKGELIGLKRLIRFSAKVPGVCHAKIGTVLKAIHEEYHDHGISRSTFKRMIQKAIHLGIFTVYETERKNGSQSSNLYVFNRYPSNEPPKPQHLNHHKETSNLSETNNKEIKERTHEKQLSLEHTFTSDRVPQPFTQLVQYFFPEARTIEEYWKMTSLCAYRLYEKTDHETVLQTAIHAFKQLIRKLKTQKSIKNPIAYYYGILKNKFFEEFFELAPDQSPEKHWSVIEWENFMNR